MYTRLRSLQGPYQVRQEGYTVHNSQIRTFALRKRVRSEDKNVEDSLKEVSF
jgi:hypothetical protein